MTASTEQRPAHTNALAHETSPYLLQHAHNPVDWRPWSEQALEEARRENKPILLSIGYSACHWCHVMAHESFEDPDTAAVMNRLFVNIKVDREERPDLDKIYQTAHYLLTHRSGGWPLTMFLLPEDSTPFFSGTYFPDRERHGMPAFRQVLEQVAAFHAAHPADLAKQKAALLDALRSEPQGHGELDRTPLDTVRDGLAQSFDHTHGGFGKAPKFPHPTSLERLLRHYALSLEQGVPDPTACAMALETLGALARGGIYDQLGGGFFRYSVDERWDIPHFEKMLYDNGPLLALYSQAWQLTRDPLFERTARDTAAWAMREMQSPEGGYWSSLDADSEGGEGSFYVWTPDQARALLDEREYALAASHFGLAHRANFEGRWHLRIHADEAQLARSHGIPPAEVRLHLDSARAKLYAAREKRPRPGRDEKVLTAWNALMIKGMAIAGRVFGVAEYSASAERALAFLHARLWSEGRLLAVYKDGRAHLNAYLDDYVFLIDALLALLENRWNRAHLEFATQLADRVLEHFYDQAGGGFYFTSDDHERLIYRPKALADDALPSGNGIAALVLGRLGHLLGEPRYLQAAERTLEAAAPLLTEMPLGHEALLNALEEALYPPRMAVLRGSIEQMQPWQARLRRCYAPRRLVFAIPANAKPNDLPAALAAKSPGNGPLAYPCSGHTCSPPLERMEELEGWATETEVPIDREHNG